MEWMAFSLVVWLAVLTAMLLIALAARIQRWEGFRLECQLAFMLLLGLVGWMTVVSLRFGSGDWVLGCLTLSATVVISSIVVPDQRVNA